MLTDRYGLGLSTASAAARDDYVHASDQALTFYPGAAEAYNRAIAADPGFALAHAGKAQVLMRGDIAGARAALEAKDVSAGLPDREASHIGSSILYSRAGPRPRSRAYTRIWRHGRATRWSSPVPQTRTA
jgi:hypothetical protein